MVCINCRAAGDINSMGGEESLVRFQHRICQYPQSCTCQHGTGGGWVRSGNDRS